MSTNISFGAEREMLPLVLDTLPIRLGFRTEQISVLSEVPVGAVIPDMLIAHWSQTPDKLPAKLTYVDASVLALLEGHRELSTGEILSRIFLAKPTADKTLRKLERIGATTKTLDGMIRISDSHATFSVEVVAVEFKLRRWKEALAQAVAYKRFADRAYVVLDGAQVEVTPDLESAFVESEVGLILQFGAELEVRVDSVKQKCISSDRILAVQKLTTAMLSGSVPNSAQTPAIFGTQTARFPGGESPCAGEKLLDGRFE